MKHLARVLAFVLALLPAVAAAQTFPTVPSGTVIGRTAIGTGPAQAIPISTLVASMLNPLTVASVNTASVVYRGATSGTATVSAQAVAGTVTLALPTTSGTVPSNVTTPIVLNATTGNLSCPTCVVSGVGYVASIAGNTGAFTLGGGVTNSGNQIRRSYTEAVSMGTPSQTLPASASALMQGYGSACTITPLTSSRARVTFDGSMSNNTAGNTTTFGVRFGTGTAPVFNAAATGTAVGTTSTFVNTGSTPTIPFSKSVILTGLTPGTAYWLDMTAAVSANTTTISGITCTANEI